MKEQYGQIIEQLYIQMYSMLFEYARSSFRNDSLAEEAVQETFRIACQKPEALCTSSNPKGWLVQTLKYVILNIKRKQQTARSVMMEYLSGQGAEIAVTNDSLKLDVTYEDLSDTDEYTLLKEMAVDGRSYLEMAKQRGISVDTCRKRVQRAKEILRKKIGK